MKLKIVAVCFLVLFAFVDLSSALTVDDVSKHLVCLCGCGEMVINTCQCGTAEEVRSMIRQRIEEGLTKDQIIESFVEQYGEKILAAPTKKGFNLTAWVLPFLALAIAGFAIPLAITRWVRRRAGEEVVFREADERYADRLERELEKFDR